jgi:hypothetical protein
MIFFVSVEDHRGSVGIVLCNPLVLIVDHFSLLVIGGVCHEVCHGGYTNCRILSTKRLVKIRVRYRSRRYLLAWVHLDLLL